MASNTGAGAALVKELLNKKNYPEWSVCVKYYLLAQDLWDVVEEDCTEPTVAWKRKNAAAFHAILISCATEAAALILDCSSAEDSARDAWNTLASAYNSGGEIVVDLLNNKNYKKWRVSMKCRLLAQGLLDVIKLSESESDKSSEIHVWKEKNDKTFDAILTSCGRQAKNLILDSWSTEDSARDAWNTLASAYNSGAVIVKDPLNKGNYDEWSVCMKRYLVNKDLWGVVESVNPSSSELESAAAEKTDLNWKRKNDLTFHTIWISCGDHAARLISNVSSAKDAWGKLANEYGSDGYDPQHRRLYNAIRIGDWNTTKEFVNAHPEVLSVKISSEGYTPLHVGAAFMHGHIVEGLVKLMSEEDLELQDAYGWTPLIHASAVGITQMAKCIVNKNKNLLTIPHSDYMLPVTQAVIGTNKEMVRYLYSVTPFEVLLPENGYYGAMLLVQCLLVKSVDMALDLLSRCPQLAITPTPDGDSFVKKFATMPSVFPSACQLRFFQKWIYERINIEPTVLVREICIDVQNSNARESKNKISLIRGLLDRTMLTFLDLLGINHVYKTKLIHKQSQEVIRITCQQISTLNTKELRKCELFVSIIQAAKYGNHEFIAELIKAHPELAWSSDDVYVNFFYSAIKYRQAEVFNLIYGYIWKDLATNTYNNDRFTMLHMAGMLAPQGQLNLISGAALQMQKELQWFKAIESIVPSEMRSFANKDNMTAKDLFIKEHKDLVKEGEQWMKETATSCTGVGALIITIMFAVAFTVPGGNNGDTGYPIFKDKISFMIFIISDAMSLFSSSTSVLMFLGILTSRYGEDDFLKSLPTKLIIGLSLLFISIATMMTAFCAALFIMLEGTLWIIAPVILLASIPISLFIKLQFPLLIEIFVSTFGRGIFKRNVEQRWP